MNFVPRWDQLRLIGQSRIVGLTMLVPFIGYLLLFNDSIWAIFKLSAEVLGAPASESGRTISRLYFLYFGLTFVGVASLIYQSLCPQPVKEHGNEYSYVSGESDLMTHTRYMNLVNPYDEVLEKDSSDYKELEGYVSRYSRASAATMDFHSSREELRNETTELEKKAFIDTLNFHWRYMCAEKPMARLLVTGFYFAGFLLVLWPSVVVFINVTTKIL